MRLIKVLEQQVQESDSELFGMRDNMERNLRYYSLKSMGNERKGTSRYISPDVHDYVESKKALFSQVFLSNRDVVKFASGGSTNPDEAVAKTSYVNKTLKAAGRDLLFHDLWHDAFLSPRCALLVEWVERDEDETVMVEQPMPIQALQAAAGQDPTIVDIDTSQLAMDPTGQLFSGELTVTRKSGEFRLTVMAPERYYRDPLAVDIEDAMWVTYADDISRASLILDGYDQEQVMSLRGADDEHNQEVQFSRDVHASRSTNTHKNRADEHEVLHVHKTWTWLNLANYDEIEVDVPDEIKLWEIHWCGGEILNWADGRQAIREVSCVPVLEWSELRLSHTYSSMSGSDVVAHSQKVNTSLKRLVIDNQQRINNTRYTAVPDFIHNPRDLIDNTTGGVIFMDRLDAIGQLEQPQLSPLTFSVLEMMSRDTEARSGLSSLTKGMNTDVLRNQNAADMVERLTNSASLRPAADARSFANTFLIPLFKLIVKLAKRHDKSTDQTESGGRMVQIAPQTWQGNDDELEVTVALTPDEAEQTGRNLITLHQLISLDPETSKLYGPEQRHAMLDDIYDAFGISDTSRYMKRPDDPSVVQENQQLQQAMQMIQMLQGQVQELQQGVIREKLDQEWAKINSSEIDKIEDNLHQTRELEVEVFQGDRKLDIEEMKARKA